MATAKRTTPKSWHAQFITCLTAQGATLCPTCGDYMVHTLPCPGRVQRLGEHGYRLDLIGGLEAEELDAEVLNAQAA